MKLFHQLLVAPAALGLLAPVAANATELNINGVSDYAATGEQVTSITQFLVALGPKTSVDKLQRERKHLLQRVSLQCCCCCFLCWYMLQG